MNCCGQNHGYFKSPTEKYEALKKEMRAYILAGVEGFVTVLLDQTQTNTGEGWASIAVRDSKKSDVLLADFWGFQNKMNTAVRRAIPAEVLAVLEKKGVHLEPLLNQNLAYLTAVAERAAEFMRNAGCTKVQVQKRPTSTN